VNFGFKGVGDPKPILSPLEMTIALFLWSCSCFYSFLIYDFCFINLSDVRNNTRGPDRYIAGMLFSKIGIDPIQRFGHSCNFAILLNEVWDETLVLGPYSFVIKFT
jgi:hypothetical protein